MSHVRLHQKGYAQASSSEGHPRHPGLERVFRLLQEVFFAEASMDKSGARSNFQMGNWAANWAVLFGEISWHGLKSQALHLSSKKKLRRPVFLGAIPTTRLSIPHTSCLRMQKKSLHWACPLWGGPFQAACKQSPLNPPRDWSSEPIYLTNCCWSLVIKTRISPSKVLLRSAQA